MYISKKVIMAILVLALSIAGVGAAAAKTGGGTQGKSSKAVFTNLTGDFSANVSGEYLAPPNAKKVTLKVDVKDDLVPEVDLRISAFCNDGEGSSSSESADKDDLSVAGKKKAKLSLKLATDPEGCDIRWSVRVEDETSFAEDGGDSRVLVTKLIAKVSAK